MSRSLIAIFFLSGVLAAQSTTNVAPAQPQAPAELTSAATNAPAAQPAATSDTAQDVNTVPTDSRAEILAAPIVRPASVRRLRMYHTHSGEHIDVVYREGDGYNPEAIEQLDYFLRDSRSGAENHFDPRLFDLLSDLLVAVGKPDAEIQVVCGYRTPKTNAALRRRSRRVARHSLHMEAMAIDIRVPGITARQLRDAALLLHRGGVGYYRRSNFVHVDVGPVRRW